MNSHLDGEAQYVPCDEAGGLVDLVVEQPVRLRVADVEDPSRPGHVAGDTAVQRESHLGTALERKRLVVSKTEIRISTFFLWGGIKIERRV